MRFWLWGGVVSAALVLLAGRATAAPINFVGDAKAAFDGGVPAMSATLGPGLDYTGSTFNVTDANGFAAIGGSAPGPNNLGWFTLAAATGTYTGHTLNLRVNFTSPPPSGGNPVNVSANILGQVVSTTGGVLVDFDNTPETVNFAGGSFTLTVNDVSLTSGAGPTPVTGTILVPEPATALLGAAGTMLLLARRRRTA